MVSGREGDMLATCPSAGSPRGADVSPGLEEEHLYSSYPPRVSGHLQTYFISQYSLVG